MGVRLRPTARLLETLAIVLLAGAGAARPDNVWAQRTPGAAANGGARLFARGLELERTADWAGAAAAFEAAFAQAPDMARACDRLGFALGQLGRTADAIARFRQAAALSPQLF